MSSLRRYWIIGLLLLAVSLAACAPTTTPTPSPRPPTATAVEATAEAVVEVTEEATAEAVVEATEEVVAEVTEAATEEVVVEAATEEAVVEVAAATEEAIVEVTEVVTEEPTATEVPPTATEVPPTATEVPPTATEVPPTEVPVVVEATTEATEEVVVEATEEVVVEATPEVAAFALPDIGDTSELTIAEIVAALAAADEPQFTVLLAAVENTPLASVTLGSESVNVTVFAPTDEAFAALLEELGLTAEELLANRTLVNQVLLYHIVNSAQMAEDVVALDGDSVPTAMGAAINISVVDGRVFLNDTVEVILTDIPAANGVIHVINAVLLPPSAE